MVGGYEDIAISGGSAENRPGFQRMIADAISPEHPFDMIIVYDISRFTSTTAALLVPVVIAGVGNDFAGLWPDASVSIGTTTEQSQPDGVPSIPAG